jgi:hypothetical protein
MEQQLQSNLIAARLAHGHLDRPSWTVMSWENREEATFAKHVYCRNVATWMLASGLVDGDEYGGTASHHHRPFYGCLSVVYLDLITGQNTLVPDASTKIYLLMFHNSHFALLQACRLC